MFDSNTGYKNARINEFSKEGNDVLAEHSFSNRMVCWKEPLQYMLGRVKEKTQEKQKPNGCIWSK